MPTFYNFTENGVVYSFDNVFVPADFFRDGNLWTWGSNANGKLGNATTVNTSTPVTTFIGGANWKQISVEDHAGAIKTDGTLWLWGNNSYGQLGNATRTSASTPVTTFLGGNDWTQVICVGNHTLAIKNNGTLWVWGSQSSGRLGNGVVTLTTVSTPVTTFLGGTNWRQVSALSSNSAAIKTDGTLWTWGLGNTGQLGNAATINVSTPVTTFLGGNNWQQVSCGFFYAAAIKTDGTLWTWGDGSSGQLGNAQTTNRSTPVTTFLGGTNWKQVSDKAAIKTDGTLWTWGSGGSGERGDASLINAKSTPVTTFLGGNNWKQVSRGVSNTAAIKSNGTLWTWGIGSSGQLGNAQTTNVSTPVTTFLGGTNWKQSFAGRDVSMALTYIDYSQTT